MQDAKTLVVIGGGATGFFAAITAAENNPTLQVIILEQGNDVLGIVKISGGGRCNVTHACFDVKELVKYYPRGHKELLGPFYQFNCEHTVDWFESRNVALKTEEDGRMFPVSNRSQSIIDCLLEQVNQLHIQVIKQAKVMRFEIGAAFTVFYNSQSLQADYVLVATGSNPTIWQLLKQAGHSIVPPVPSLFTFNSKHALLQGLEGVALPNVQVSMDGTNIRTQGAVLITHTGLSGPAILKFSAFAARLLHEKNYQFELNINWIQLTLDAAIQQLKQEKELQAKKQANNFSPFNVPNRFWLHVLQVNGISPNKLVADLSKQDIQHIAHTLTQSRVPVFSKNTNKDEFVTAGGIALKEVDFKTMESKMVPNLFLAGEVLDIDAVTGGFNFQAAWTTGYLAGTEISRR